MRVRAYLNMAIDFELPVELAARLTSEAGVVDSTGELAFIDRQVDSIACTLVDIALGSCLADAAMTTWSTICRVCGCTEEEACPGGCSWLEPDLCTACVGREAPT